MNLDPAAHLAAFREALARELPKEARRYVNEKLMPSPGRFTYYGDFVRVARSAAMVAAQEANVSHYRLAVVEWQRRMLMALDTMLGEELWGHDGVPAERLELLLCDPHYGWQWFKYCRNGFKKTVFAGKKAVDCAFIPRYSPELRTQWQDKAEVIIDASELNVMFGAELARVVRRLPSLPLHELRLLFKLKHPGIKVLSVDGEQVGYSPLDKLNKNFEVDDWSLPLWREL